MIAALVAAGGAAADGARSRRWCADEPRRMGWKRITFGVAAGRRGANCGVLTVLLFKDGGSDAMQTAGQASIWASIGLALLAPALVRGVTAVLAGPLARAGRRQRLPDRRQPAAPLAPDGRRA